MIDAYQQFVGVRSFASDLETFKEISIYFNLLIFEIPIKMRVFRVVECGFSYFMNWKNKTAQFLCFKLKIN